MRNGDETQIRAIWSQPNAVEPHKRSLLAKEVLTALFMVKQRQSKAKNDERASNISLWRKQRVRTKAYSNKP